MPATPSTITVTGTSGADAIDVSAVAAPHVIDGLDGKQDTITDFTIGVGGDILDIGDLLVGYASGTDDISDFITLVDDGTDTIVKIDADGAGSAGSAGSGGSSYTTLVLLQGITGSILDDLVDDGNLVVA